MTTLVVVVAVICAGAVITWVGARLIERAHPPRGRFIVVDGLRQHVLELGAANAFPEALPIVLLHGAGANLEDMHLALGDRLAARHHVILLDRPGLGWSKRQQHSCSPADQANLVRGVLDQLGVRRAIFVGHSWGATLALAFALDHPERVAGLVLIAAPTHPGLRYMAWLSTALATPLGRLFAHTLALPFGALLLSPGVRTAFLPQSPPRHYVRRTAARLILRPATLLANWADVGCLEESLMQQAARYHTLAAPVAVIAGDDDVIVRTEHHGAKLAEAVPGAKLVVLSGFGHMLHYAAAEHIVSTIEEMTSPSLVP
jgi:pimeloyl-ACP methyl ester carboxylesterase